MKIEQGSRDNGAKRRLYDSFARIAKGLAHGTRLELLVELAQRTQNVESLSTCCGLTVGMTSRQLQVLRNAGLVEARRDGKRVVYSVASKQVLELVMCLMQVAEKQSAQTRRIVSEQFPEHALFAAVPNAVLARKLKSGKVTLLDVRPSADFDAGRIAGAINAPLGDLAARLETLPGGREVVIYCGTAHWALSPSAAQTLRRKGVAAGRLEDGFLGWQAEGYAIEKAQTTHKKDGRSKRRSGRR